MRLFRRSIAAVFVVCSLASAPVEAQLRFAELGTCPTQAGEPVQECRIGYRTLGTLNPARDNAVLIPSWYGGTSQSLLRLINEAAMVDTTRFYVVLVDALGDGVSTSPSNSRLQPAAAFPRLTVSDMVAAQHRLVKDVLQLPRLHAVLGYSLGAFQALEWGVRHPDQVGAVVALHGSPRLGTHDVFTFRVMRSLVELAQRSGLPRDSANVPLVDMWHVVRATPAQINEMPVEKVNEIVLRIAAGWNAFNHHDNLIQLEAIMAHDLAASFGGDLARAAGALQARTLLVVSPDDRIVGAEPAVSFARLAGAELLSVPSACGHFALYCEPEIAARVRAFLQPQHATGGAR